MAEGLTNNRRLSDLRAGLPQSARALTPPHLVHVFPTFGVGGVPIRMSDIINHFGKKYRHTVISLDGVNTCGARLHRDVDVTLVPSPIKKSALLRTLYQIYKVMKKLRPDLLLTYNWGSIEWVLVNTLTSLSPHIHLESGFGPDEADQQILRRVLFRRLALLGASRVIVPSRSLVELATGVWKIARLKILYIPNGVDCIKFAAAVPVKTGAPLLSKRDDEVLVGTIAPLRREKNLARLLRAFAGVGVPSNPRLVIVGEGPERGPLERLAEGLGVAARVTFAGGTDSPEKLLGWLDVFAITSDTEQMPNSLLQAMAAGRPIVGVDVGDIKRMVHPENERFIVPKADEARFRDALSTLISDRALREQLGRCNSEHVRAHYDQQRMFDLYEKAIDGCLGAKVSVSATQS